MLQALLASATAKAVAVAAASATVAGGAALVTLPDAAENSRAVETVEVEEVETEELVSSADEPIEIPLEEDEEADDEGTPPEDSFAATVHGLQEQHPEGGRDFGQAVAEAAQAHGAERRAAAPIPEIAQEKMAEAPASDDAGAPEDVPAGPPSEVPAGPPSDTPGGRPGG